MQASEEASVLQPEQLVPKPVQPVVEEVVGVEELDTERDTDSGSKLAEGDSLAVEGSHQGSYHKEEAIREVVRSVVDCSWALPLFPNSDPIQIQSYPLLAAVECRPNIASDTRQPHPSSGSYECGS